MEIQKMIEPYVAITIISYGVTEVIKSTKLVPNEVIPLVSVFIGIFCSVVALVYNIDIGGNNIIDIFAVGIASGLSAIGLNQIPKQIKKAV